MRINKVPFIVAPVLPTVFGESLSYTEELGKVVHTLNQVISLVNDTLGNGVADAVSKVLQNWVDDGTMIKLIEANVFDDFVSQLNGLVGAYNTLTENYNTLSGNKITKNEPNSVNMGMLANDVKQAMTGGSVAVVGANSVGNAELQAKAVTASKIWLGLFTARPRVALNPIKVDTVAKTITVNDGFYIGYTINNPSTLPNVVSFAGVETATFWVTYDYTNRTMLIKTALSDIDFSNEILLLYSNKLGTAVANLTNLELLIDGLPFTASVNYHTPKIISGVPAIIDYWNAKLVMPDSLILYYANRRVTLVGIENKEINLGNKNEMVWLDISNNKYVVTDSACTGATNGCVLLGYLFESNYKSFCNIPFANSYNYYTCLGDSINVKTNDRLYPFTGYVGSSYTVGILRYAVSGAGYTVSSNLVKDQIINLNSTGDESIITVHAGVNDWWQGTDINTLKNSVQEVIDMIISIRPNSLLYILIPVPSNRQSSGLGKWDDVERNGLKFSEVCDAIRSVALSNGVCVVDMYKEFEDMFKGVHLTGTQEQLNRFTADYIPDGVHPGKKLAALMGGCLNRELAYLAPAYM